MPLLLDHEPVDVTFEANATLNDALDWVDSQLPPSRIVVRVLLEGETLDGERFIEARKVSLERKTVDVRTGDKKELSLTLLGKLAALIEWLSPQHKDVAALLESGNSPAALQRLAGILSAWQQIQDAYGKLAKLIGVTLAELPVRELNGEAVLGEFCRQLGEIQTALQSQDFVLLADILQYEMEGAIANWMAILESTLGIIEPVPA